MILRSGYFKFCKSSASFVRTLNPRLSRPCSKMAGGMSLTNILATCSLILLQLAIATELNPTTSRAADHELNPKGPHATELHPTASRAAELDLTASRAAELQTTGSGAAELQTTGSRSAESGHMRAGDTPDRVPETIKGALRAGEFTHRCSD